MAVCVLGGKIFSVACPFPVKNVTVAISRFYQFSITIALRISAKKDIFPHGEIEKLLSWGSPAAAGMGDWGKERAAGTVPAARMFFVDNFIFNMFHYVFNIAMQNVT